MATFTGTVVQLLLLDYKLKTLISLKIDSANVESDSPADLQLFMWKEFNHRHELA